MTRLCFFKSALLPLPLLVHWKRALLVFPCTLSVLETVTKTLIGSKRRATASVGARQGLFPQSFDECNLRPRRFGRTAAPSLARSLPCGMRIPSRFTYLELTSSSLAFAKRRGRAQERRGSERENSLSFSFSLSRKRKADYLFSEETREAEFCNSFFFRFALFAFSRFDMQALLPPCTTRDRTLEFWDAASHAPAALGIRVR